MRKIGKREKRREEKGRAWEIEKKK
jgi:hypothetical protein